MATAETQEDIFECSVCLNYMLDRNPRSLSCLHTFCEDCLRQLINNKKIRCPTCREITELKKNEVKELKVNFHLLKIKDIGNQPKSSTKEKAQSKDKLKSQCQICDMKTPVYKCKDCPQLMCESCKNDHNDMFEGHAVFEMCVKHEESITHLCKKCVRQLCMKCAVLDHKEHKTHFVDYTKGTQELKEEVKTLHSNIKEEIKKIDSHLDATNMNHEITLDMSKSFTARRQYHREQIEEIDKLSGVLKKKNEEYERIQKVCIETRDQCNVRAASLKALTDDSPGFCNRYSQIKPKAQEVIEEAKQNLQVQYKPPTFVLCENKEQPLVINTKSGKMMKEKLLLDIPRSDKINCKEQIAVVGKDVVLVTYNSPQHVVRLNERGGVVARYYPEMKGDVNGVSVYDNRIYIIQDEAISVISQKYGKDTVVYKPDVPRIEKILVVDKSTMFITCSRASGGWLGGYEEGIVYKYNTDSNQTTVVVKDLICPCYLSVMFTLQGPRYIVSESNAKKTSFFLLDIDSPSYSSIKIYDQTWHLLNNIKQEQVLKANMFEPIYPRATAVTECGLLVADRNNRTISHYSLEGQFLGHVITKEDGLDYQPRGIAYRYPYLWVCGNDDPVKCYQVKYQ